MAQIKQNAAPRSTKDIRWYRLAAPEVAERLSVDSAQGLSSGESKRRLAESGLNQLAEKKQEAGLLRFLRQYREFMQIVLLIAAILSFILTRQISTTFVLVALTVFNAYMGMSQEAKAQASLASLAGTMKSRTRVRRDGQVLEIATEELTPGDIVLLEAGNQVPADGRLFVTATFEVEEAALTGESTPVLKQTDALPGDNLGLGDQTCMVFMNTSVTRGRGEFMVTATGVNTEIGHIATLLNKTKVSKTPLQKELDRLTLIIAGIALLAFILMVILGIRDGQPFQALFVAGVALAISAIPSGMPTIVTALYSLAARTLAQHNAIIKRLPSVETLGSVSAICSDKTGTLTLNMMTAREFTIPGINHYKVTGEGYSTEGSLLHSGGTQIDLSRVLLPMALCSDARLDGDTLIGDPTEGALIVLAAKGGLDVDGARRMFPRLAEVPFDADYKFMATFHAMDNDSGAPVIRCFVKGAPDVLIARGGSFWLPDGRTIPVNDGNRALALDENTRMASAGERVMVVAQRDFDPATFDAHAELLPLVNDLTLLAMVGIVDPPRPEAREAIANCRSAGMQVRMITGDHAVTAAAIGRELGIDGKAITGAQFAAMTDEELIAQLPEIGVVARVNPEDKIRMVELLQRMDHIVAMTGDGVNDAPALKRADIGVAMGITGTEVSKGAAVMILTDDNFATIVRAVRYGRAIYDNLSKYIRFQMVGLVSIIATFLGAALLRIAGGIPFAPLVVLWINFTIQTPIAISLGYDKPTTDLMARKPRPLRKPVLSSMQWLRIIITGVAIAAGTLALQSRYAAGGPVVAATIAFAAYSLANIVIGLSARSETGSAFDPAGLSDRRRLMLLGIALLATILPTEFGFTQRLMGITSLTGTQWLACFAFAAVLLLLDEALKWFLRSQNKPLQSEPASA
jgi:Ca2+-transporting ATPase